MSTNLDRFKDDLTKLIKFGRDLEFSMEYHSSSSPDQKEIKKRLSADADKIIAALPNFGREYQRWYSEALALLRQLLPDRIADFSRHYEAPKSRREFTNDSHRIEDYLQGLQATKGTEIVVRMSAAVPHMRQQLAIVKAAEARFESSLFDIRQLVQADLLDSEISAAEVLAKHKFTRAAGALAGVVLERHLGQVCADHKIAVGKKNPTINDFNETLKAASAIDVPQWRFIQHLADIRNLCDHSKIPEPTADQVADLIAGVKKVSKTVY